MPRRDDLHSILLIGSGPIVIGQACEFDYSGTQACRVLREEGYRVILANSNPATIMTDPDFADATYVEPLDVEILTKIIEKERPDALLPTLGGQTALNLAMELVEAGVLERYGVELIGADAEAIATAENRERFKDAMIGIGLEVPASGVAGPPDELRKAPKKEQVAAAMEVARRVVADIGLNWLMSGHSQKLSLDLQNRPVFAVHATTGDLKQSMRKSALILQYQTAF